MLRWTAKVVDACPQFCLRCETRIKHILLSQGLAVGYIIVRCGHCGKLLGRVPSRWVKPDPEPIATASTPEGPPEDPPVWV